MAFKPVIENVTSIISSTLINEILFSKFIIKNQFILGGLLNIYHGSPLHQKIKSILQEASDVSVEKKELRTYSFVLLKSIDCLLQPKIGDQYFYMRFFIKVVCIKCHTRITAWISILQEHKKTYK